MEPSEIRPLLRQGPPRARIAIVGASNDRRKYGNIILRDLLRKGYQVVPVNPLHPQVEGIRTEASVTAVVDVVDVVDFVVPPEVTLAVLGELDPTSPCVLWLQPGSFDRAVLDLVAARGFERVIAGDCIMVETR